MGQYDILEIIRINYPKKLTVREINKLIYKDNNNPSWTCNSLKQLVKHKLIKKTWKKINNRLVPVYSIEGIKK